MNTDSGVKSKFNKKMLAVAVIVITVVAGVVSWQIYGQSSNATKNEVFLPALNLTLVGANGQQLVLNSSQLAALKSYSAAGGYIDDKNTSYVGNFTGVPILTLLNLVGGITSTETVTITGSDGYKVTFTYQQVQGEGLNTYDPTTKAVAQPSQPLTMIVAYYCNGTTLASDKGPLSAAFVGPQGLLTQGRYWAYFLVKIEIIGA
ncbi:MAG TPA: hypothetical protein VLU95_06015 [Candidatus Acidoferrum sp.]|nr:hypothetical protein [Candidatus Acidoferrum sp.]